MINAKIVVRDINYDKIVVGLYPMFMDHCREMICPSLPVRFLLKMGNAARKAVRGLLDRIPNQTKGEVICWIIQKYNYVILQKFNQVLNQYRLATVGGISAVQGIEGQITLNIWDIEIDYNGFVRSSTGKQIIEDFAKEHMGIFGGVGRNILAFVAKIVSGFAPKFEKFAVSQLERQKYKNKIYDSIHEILEKNHVYLKLTEFSFGYGRMTFDDTQSWVQISDYDLEEKLMDIVVKYLKVLLE